MNREACCLQLGQLTDANWNHPLASGFTRERRLLHPATALRHSTNELLTELKLNLDLEKKKGGSATRCTLIEGFFSAELSPVMMTAMIPAECSQSCNHCHVIIINIRVMSQSGLTVSYSEIGPEVTLRTLVTSCSKLRLPRSSTVSAWRAAHSVAHRWDTTSPWITRASPRGADFRLRSGFALAD